MICATCKDQEKLGTDPRPRFGGVFELRETNSSAHGYWGERWELYKVHLQCVSHCATGLAGHHTLLGPRDCALSSRARCRHRMANALLA